ncbi:MAG: Asp23/Gls24 family envelope stress response protein [Clostridia bacterium]|nr:Asp23/Gls24 family envelope stress response protein [Clostridia bacterium]
MEDKDINLNHEPTEEEIDIGTVKISPDVISAIASVAVTETDGIAGVAQSITGGLAELLSKRNVPRGIKVEINNGSAVIDAHIIVQYGAVIPVVSEKLQAKIKDDVETMTGISVERINIHVQGVKLETGDPAPDKKAAEDIEPEAKDEAEKSEEGAAEGENA